MITDTQRKNQLRKAIQLIDIVNDKLEMVYEQHKAYCIEHNGAGLNPGYTLEDL